MIYMELLATWHLVVGLRLAANKTPGRTSYWDSLHGLSTVSRESFLPCIVLATGIRVRDRKRAGEHDVLPPNKGLAVKARYQILMCYVL